MTKTCSQNHNGSLKTISLWYFLPISLVCTLVSCVKVNTFSLSSSLLLTHIVGMRCYQEHIAL